MIRQRDERCDCIIRFYETLNLIVSLWIKEDVAIDKFGLFTFLPISQYAIKSLISIFNKLS